LFKPDLAWPGQETKVGVLVGAVTKSGFTEDIKNAAKEVVKRWKSVVR
jgi:hypothetical protein